MTLSRLVFAALAMLHLCGFFFALDALAPLLAGSIYLPLMLLKFAGLPVYASAEAWGWARPSPFGWAAVALLWALVWWGVARLATRWQGRRSGAPEAAERLP